MAGNLPSGLRSRGACRREEESRSRVGTLGPNTAKNNTELTRQEDIDENKPIGNVYVGHRLQTTTLVFGSILP